MPRASWRGFLRLSLVSCPIYLSPATTRTKPIRLHQVWQGGGPMARLPRLVGSGHAMEILIGADDFGGGLAERYGYVNRALPDAELDGFVDALATRIASFDQQTIADTKKLVDLASMPPDAEMQPGWDAFIKSVQRRPGAQARVKALIENGLGQPGDLEKHLGQYTAKYTE